MTVDEYIKIFMENLKVPGLIDIEIITTRKTEYGRAKVTYRYSDYKEEGNETLHTRG